MFKRILILILSIFVLQKAEVHATHIVGGNMAYEYLGQNGGNYDYRITFTTYIDCNSIYWGQGFPEPILPVGIYEGPAQPTGNLPRRSIINLPIVDSTSISATVSDTCAVGTSICVYEVVYQGVVSLPLSFQGYHLFYDRCCRVGSIVNLNLPGNQGLAFHAFIPPTLVNNSSPVFSDVPVPFLCVTDTTSILNTAFDPDGDVLIFSFEDPYQGFGTPLAPAPPLPFTLTWPIPSVNWRNGYNKNQPFGAGGYAYINSATGYSRYMSNATGNYVVAVEIKEYRNGNLIGITRRDMQILIDNCPNNPTPNLVAASGSGQTNYTITEGDSICFPIIYADQFGDSLTLTANGPIFDALQVSPPAIVSTPVKGDSIVSTQFCWDTECGQAQALPYVFTVSVEDNGCPHKTTNTVYSIQVNPFQGPLQIDGPDQVCVLSTGNTYSVTPSPGATYNWSVSGGSQASGGNSNVITVDWGSAGSGSVMVTTFSADSCNGGTLSKVVTISTGPTVEAGNDTTLCSGDTLQIGGSISPGTTYSWSPSTGLDNPNIANPNLSLTNTGGSIVTHTYILTGNDTVLGCSLTDTIEVDVRPQPPVFAGNDTTVCLGNSLQLSASGAVNYLWQPASGLSSTTGANPTFNSTISSTYTVTGTDASGCSNTDDITISVVTAAPADAGIPSWLCPGDSVQLNASGGVAYTWSPAQGVGNTTLSNPNVSPSTTTQYTVTVTDASGCTGSDTVTITVAGNVPAEAGNPQQICVGDSVTIGGSPSAPQGSTYNWSPSTGLSSASVANPIASPTVTTRYYLTVSNDTCGGIDSVDVTVLTPPPVNVDSNSNICIGGFVTLSASGAISYSWSPAAGLSNTTGSSVFAGPTSSTTYTVIGTDLNGCTNTDTVSIIINPLPTIDAGNNTSVCNGASTTLSASGGISYSWSPATGLSTTTGPNPIAQPTVATTYTLIGTDANGCTATDTVRVNVSNNPIINALPNDTSICLGISLTMNASGGVSYAWLPSAGLSATAGPITNANPTTTTTYTVIGTDASGCNGFDTVRVDVNPPPNIDAGINQAICIGGTANLSASGGVSYVWTPGPGLSSLTGSNPTANPTSTSSYTVTGTDVNGCTNSDTVIVTVNPLPNIMAGNDTFICENDTLSLLASGGINYSWSPSATLNNPGIANPMAFPSSSTTYTVTGVDANGCVNADTTLVEVFKVEVSDTFVCDNALFWGVHLDANTNNAISYSWSPGTSLSATNIADPIASPSVQTTYTVVANSNQGCVSIGIVTVSISPAPTAEFYVELVPNCDSVCVEAINISTGADFYVWDLGFGFTDTTTTTESGIVCLPYNEDQMIGLKAFTNLGCQSADRERVVINGFNELLSYTQPNVITPNYDGFNDLFKIELNGEFLGCTHLKIFNRWGVLLFESELYNQGWDGRTTAGEPVPDGTYYYVYTINNLELKGFITLLR